jgi:hypothetical protein
VSDAAQLPESSYRLGVRPAPLHDLYPGPLSAALAAALTEFDRRLPGFASGGRGLLHGVETRTSAPVRVERRAEDCCRCGAQSAVRDRRGGSDAARRPRAQPVLACRAAPGR